MELLEGFPELGPGTGEFSNFPPFQWEREVTETILPDVRRVLLRVVWDERIPSGVELVYYIRDHTEPPQ